jgi:hypothetical protein
LNVRFDRSKTNKINKKTGGLKMGLDVTVGINGITETLHFSKDGGPDHTIIPGGPPDGTTLKGLIQNDYVDMHIGAGTAEDKFKISFQTTAGNPFFKLVRTGTNGTQWQFFNIGTNTSATVEAGPDGQ